MNTPQTPTTTTKTQYIVVSIGFALCTLLTFAGIFVAYKNQETPPKPTQVKKTEQNTEKEKKPDHELVVTILQDYTNKTAQETLDSFNIDFHKQIVFKDGKKDLKHTDLDGYVVYMQSPPKNTSWDWSEGKKLTFFVEKREKTENTTNTSEEQEETVETTTNNNEALPVSKATNDTSGRIIWVGDSRFVGMSSIPEIDANKDIVIAKGSMGLNWFLNDALAQVEANYQEGDTIVYNLGVNDMYQSQRHIETLNHLMETTWKGRRVVYMSVNPIDDNKATANGYRVKNQNVIDAFANFKNQLHPDIEYLDTYSLLYPQINTATFDGIHYTTNASQQIYHWARDYVEGN